MKTDEINTPCLQSENRHNECDGELVQSSIGLCACSCHKIVDQVRASNIELLEIVFNDHLKYHKGDKNQCSYTVGMQIAIAKLKEVI